MTPLNRANQYLKYVDYQRSKGKKAISYAEFTAKALDKNGVQR